ncbi:hypothetical protein [Myceligenerans crystallogenes]|uniref:Secreted protein n=1 Tax=Myceligenerans crystallogenes TaxID=316335 RepID=A0ABP4ZAL8_9MICO
MNRTAGARGLRIATLTSAVIACVTLTGCAGADTTGGGPPAGDGTAITSAPSEAATPSDTASAGGGDEENDMDSTEPRNARPKIEAKDIDPLEAGATGRGLPPGLKGSTSSTAGAAWSPEAGLVYVVTNDSSSCPIIAEPNATAEGGEIVVGLLPRRDGMCTMDFAPTTSVVELPGDVADGSAVTLRLGDQGSVDLPARETAGEPGAIAWVSK